MFGYLAHGGLFLSSFLNEILWVQNVGEMWLKFCYYRYYTLDLYSVKTMNFTISHYFEIIVEQNLRLCNQAS